jgi:hypothetical protein
MKQYINSLIFSILIIFMTAVPSISAEKADAPKTDAAPMSHYINVTYFHTTAR